jgi:hypothetical protein
METFNRILVAHFSPQNRCHVPEDEVLTVVPRKNLLAKRDLSHHFVSARDPKVKSVYGWVRETQPFTIEEFAREYLRGRELAPAEREHLITMFSSIATLPSGTAVGADYVVRCVIEKQTALSVHKVVFYPARK